MATTIRVHENQQSKCCCMTINIEWWNKRGVFFVLKAKNKILRCLYSWEEKKKDYSHIQPLLESKHPSSASSLYQAVHKHPELELGSNLNSDGCFQAQNSYSLPTPLTTESFSVLSPSEHHSCITCFSICPLSPSSSCLPGYQRLSTPCPTVLQESLACRDPLKDVPWWRSWILCFFG